MLTINVAHSPDADDFFLFWAISNGLFRTPGFEFNFTVLDTEDLNTKAESGMFDICAISAAAYSRVSRDYLILNSGASVARQGYGPVLVSKSAVDISELRTARIGVPGLNTTACAIVKSLLPEASLLEIPLRPHGLVFEQLDMGYCQAAALIHEGQLDYARRGYQLVRNLGEYWITETSLPLPLGVNVISRRFSGAELSLLSALCEKSVQLALDRREQILPELFSLTQVKQGKLSTLAELDRYLNQYANEDSLRLKSDVRQALNLLLNQQVEIV